jgi:hypothetical protein
LRKPTKAPVPKAYVWAVSAVIDGSPADHTWVTTYDSRRTTYKNVRDVIRANENHWCCFERSFTPKGRKRGGFLGVETINLKFAECLVRPNADSRSVQDARGTIFRYGWDGVCHQLANQVLYATGADGRDPLTVEKAKCYWASAFFYGDYGKQQQTWQTKISSCRLKIDKERETDAK